jgi:Reverse transcriptase (RNA-dependent DNA polymerase)
LVEIVDSIRLATDNHEFTILVLLDFSNAFTSVNFDVLLMVMKHHFNFSNNAVALFHSYFSGRSQCVSFKGNASKWLPIISGVPQGSVLGPRLFNVYINELFQIVRNCDPMGYADDVQLKFHCTFEDLIHGINCVNEDIQIISEWSAARFMQLNPRKTQAIIFGHPNDLKNLNFDLLPNIFVGGVPIPFTTCVKDLGILLDDSLSWSNQVSSLSRKVIGGLYSLNRFKNFIPDDLKKHIVEALIFPHFYYCDVLYTDLNVRQISKLQMLQNACVRFVFGLRKYDYGISRGYTELRWNKLDELRKFHVMTLLFRCLQDDFFPRYLKDRFITLAHSHGRNTRSGSNFTLKLPNYNLSSYKFSFTTSSARSWNCLPVSLRNSPSLLSFKNNYKKMYLEYS